ncbi:MAG: hypothetical protein IPK17_20795 [Chloroflexi bacterium]|uniref:hypothetical protein n=1 Tax=Candidatus Flexifilum breve TaxID=3140694 RepID=UPI0031363082|nr:hypothetical protein [Chloroflexota bacterium]
MIRDVAAAIHVVDAHAAPFALVGGHQQMFCFSRRAERVRVRMFQQQQVIIAACANLVREAILQRERLLVGDYT